MATAKPIPSLQIFGNACVFIDWANVYGWSRSLKKEVDPQLLYHVLTKQLNIQEVNLYFGTDVHPKSRQFLKSVKQLGFRVITKPVKHIIIAKVAGKLITQRKCDFDIEIVMDIYQYLAQSYDTFIFFSGDGDFQPIYKHLIKHNKKVIVIYMYGHLGKEVYELKQGIYKLAITAFEKRVGGKVTKKMTRVLRNKSARARLQ